MLTSEQEFVMGEPQKKHHPKSDQDATLAQNAFTTTITRGTNIQFNSMTMEVAGSLSDNHHTL